MFNILTLNKISEKGLAVLPKENYTIVDECNAPDGIILRSFKMHEYEVPSSLQAIGRAGAGVNNIPIDEMAQKGVVVFNTPGANSNAVAELCVAGMFLAARNIVEGVNWASTLEDDVAKTVEKGKSNFAGTEVLGKKIGLVGLGAIGSKVANMCLSLGMEVYGYAPRLSRKNALATPKDVKMVDSLEELAKVSDYISLHFPAKADTKGIVNKEFLNNCKDGVVFLNFARAELVNSDDMKEALGNGKVRKYVVDFPTDDMVNVENVVLIPHLGASSAEAEENCAYMASAQLKEYLEVGNIVNSVNYPSVSLPYTGKTRYCVLYKADENVTKDVTATVGNVLAMASGESGGFGYLIVDTDKDVDLTNIENVIKVRKI